MTTCRQRQPHELHGITIAFIGLLLLTACCLAGPLLMVLVSRLW
ncbi:hypothetical protein [Geobacter sp. FeAm09]|nr:hypothetical protein [Geobacter sp. FeAm09]